MYIYGITMYETSLFDNKLNSAPSQTPWRALIALDRPPTAYATRKWSAETTQLSLRAQSAGHDQVVGLRNSRPRSHRLPPRRGSSCRPSSPGVPFFVVWPQCWITSRRFQSSKSSQLYPHYLQLLIQWAKTVSNRRSHCNEAWRTRQKVSCNNARR